MLAGDDLQSTEPRLPDSADDGALPPHEKDAGRGPACTAERKDPTEESSVKDAFDQAHSVIDGANEWLNEEGLSHFIIDNAAVLADNLSDMEKFVSFCKIAGMEHYKRSHEHVMCPTHGDSYEVAFDFLRWPTGTYSGRPFRIEAMYITGGDSKVHRLFRRESPSSNLYVVQVSMKALNLRQMSKVRSHLRRVGMEQAAFFVGDYGPYDYWRGGTWPWRTYLKTRVNMRD